MIEALTPVDAETQAACASLMQRWTWYLDQAQYSLATGLFAVDGEFHSQSGAVLKGTDAIGALLASRDPRRVTFHLLGPPLVFMIDPETTGGIGRFSIHEAFREENEETSVLSLADTLAIGEFHQNYRLIDGAWRIVSHRSVPRARRRTAV